MFKIPLLIFGVFACSTGVIMIKGSSEHPVIVAALRLLVSAFILLPFFLRDYMKHRESYTARHLRASLLPGLALALHYMSWVTAARMTTAVNAGLIVNLVPIVMPFLLILMVKERLTFNEYAATVLATVGMVLLMSADFNISRVYFTGDLLCFLSMLLFALYLVLGRRNTYFISLWLYVVPLYLFAGLLCLAVSFFFQNPIKPYATREILLISGLGIVPTVMGHSILNYSMKHLRGQLVGIMNMGQFIFAGIMGYYFFREFPNWGFYPASVLLVISGWLVTRRGNFQAFLHTVHELFKSRGGFRREV